MTDFVWVQGRDLQAGDVIIGRVRNYDERVVEWWTGEYPTRATSEIHSICTAVGVCVTTVVDPVPWARHTVPSVIQFRPDQWVAIEEDP